jgi:hypothetical protein
VHNKVRNTFAIKKKCSFTAHLGMMNTGGIFLQGDRICGKVFCSNIVFEYLSMTTSTVKKHGVPKYFKKS